MRRRAAPPGAQGPLPGSGRRPEAFCPCLCTATQSHQETTGQQAGRVLYCTGGGAGFFLGPSWSGERGKAAAICEGLRDCMSEEAAPYTSKTGLGGPPLLSHCRISSPDPSCCLHPPSWLSTETAAFSESGAAAAAEAAQVWCPHVTFHSCQRRARPVLGLVSRYAGLSPGPPASHHSGSQIATSSAHTCTAC